MSCPSYAIHDALRSVDVPAVEVHISDISAREPWRHVSVTAPACVRTIAGLGFDGYLDIGLYDTMADLFVNFIGAVVFSTIGYFYIKHRGKGKLAAALIPVVLDPEKEKSKKDEQNREPNDE